MREYALNVLSDLETPEGKMFLKELYCEVIANVQKDSVVTDLKNTRLSGDPEAGSVEAKRFQNISSKEYGTARAAGKGEAVKGRPVTINLDTDREFVEELEKKDTRLLGVQGLVMDRAKEHQLGMVWELESAFFACAKSEGTQYKPATTLATIKDIIDDAVVQLSKLKNNYIRGVNKNLMKLICCPEVYSELHDYIDTRNNANIDTAAENIVRFHGVEIVECINLPGETSEGAGDDVKFVLMVKQSIAQPVHSDTYQAERINLSNAYSVEMFYTYGTKAVTPETILWYDGTKLTPPTAKATKTAAKKEETKSSK